MNKVSKMLKALGIALTVAGASLAYSFTAPQTAYADCADPTSVYCLDAPYSNQGDGEGGGYCQGDQCDSEVQICCAG